MAGNVAAGRRDRSSIGAVRLSRGTGVYPGL